MNKLPFLSFALLLSTVMEAQLPVDREPHHKVILQNEYLRLLEGVIAAGDSTPAHVHAANSVVVFLSHSTFGIQVIGEKPVIATVNPGDVRHVAYGDKPVNHIVWNESGPPLHFFVVELPKGRSARDTGIVVTGDRRGHLAPSSSARLLILPDNRYRFYPPNVAADWSDTGRSVLVEIN